MNSPGGFQGHADKPRFALVVIASALRFSFLVLRVLDGQSFGIGVVQWDQLPDQFADYQLCPHRGPSCLGHVARYRHGQLL